MEEALLGLVASGRLTISPRFLLSKKMMLCLAAAGASCERNRRPSRRRIPALGSIVSLKLHRPVYHHAMSSRIEIGSTESHPRCRNARVDRPLRRYKQGPRRKREIETTLQRTPCGRGSSCCHHFWVCTRHPGGARCVEFRDVVYPGLFLFKCESAARLLNTTGCIVCNSHSRVELFTTNTEVEQIGKSS